MRVAVPIFGSRAARPWPPRPAGVRKPGKGAQVVATVIRAPAELDRIGVDSHVLATQAAVARPTLHRAWSTSRHAGWSPRPAGPARPSRVVQDRSTRG